MPCTQGIRDDLTKKPKKFKIFSEFNCSPTVDECLLGQTDFSGFPHLCYNQNILPFLEGYMQQRTTPCEDIINVYQRDNKPRTPITKNKSVANMREHVCYISDLESLWAEHNCYNYTGTDINRLLLFMEYTYNTMHRLLQDINTPKKTKMSITDPPTFFPTILVIDSEKLKKFLKSESPKKKTYEKQNYTDNFTGGDIYDSFEKTPSLSNNGIKNTFNITIEQQCMEFKLSICKYSFKNLLDTLSAVCNFSRLFFPIYEFSKAPSLFLGNWHFQNISQGYLLRILLRTVKVNTLNVMRKLYFVLITDNTPNLNVQINFILKHDVFIVCDSCLPNAYYPGVRNWNNDHNIFLKKSTSTDSLFLLSNMYKKQNKYNLLRALAYSTPSYSSLASSITFPMERYKGSSTSYSVELYRGSSTTYPIEMFEGSSRTYIKDNASILYSDTESLNPIQSGTTIPMCFTVDQCVGTSLIMFEETPTQWQLLEKKSASTLCNIWNEYDFSASLSLLMKKQMWMTKGSDAIKTCLNVPSEHELINETMFNADDYVQFFDKYWKQFTCHKFNKSFFLCLAQSLLYILFSYKI